MGMCLDFESRSTVSKEIRNDVVAEVERIERDWWCEDLSFFDDEVAQGRLMGSTKLKLFDYSISDPPGFMSVDGDESSFMAGMDALFIVACLCKWSAQYGITWDLTYGGEPAGTIRNGEVDEEVRQFVAFFELDNPLKLDDPNAVQHARRISAKYASRND